MANPFDIIYEKCRPYTMTSKERMAALYASVEHIVTGKVTGDIVECGVWKGGSMMLVAETLLQLGDTSRTLFMYDTFEGMTAPQEMDYDHNGTPAADQYRKGWGACPVAEVMANMIKTGYPNNKMRFIQGDVLKTIPKITHERIALLRLDTDWYASTRHELKHLYPLLSENGVLIVDDYGHWNGCRRAVDEYFGKDIEFAEIDYTGRMLIK